MVSDLQFEEQHKTQLITHTEEEKDDKEEAEREQSQFTESQQERDRSHELQRSIQTSSSCHAEKLERRSKTSKTAERRFCFDIIKI